MTRDNGGSRGKMRKHSALFRPLRPAAVRRNEAVPFILAVYPIPSLYFYCGVIGRLRSFMPNTVNHRKRNGPMSRKRVVIENLKPEVDEGLFPVKRIVGEKVTVEADAFADGHDKVVCRLLYRTEDSREWQYSWMEAIGNDRWRAAFRVHKQGITFYTVQAWIDHFGTYRQDLRKKHEAGQDVHVELLMAIPYLKRMYELARDKGGASGDAALLEEWIAAFSSGNEDLSVLVQLVLSERMEELSLHYPLKDNSTLYRRELGVRVDREKALYGAWYELFPRSVCTPQAKAGVYGTFADVEKQLPDIAGLGFDVLYFPPIHPIGVTKRKGRNNAVNARPEDPGSPWAIGSSEGGHKAVDPRLGTIDDFERLVEKARKINIEIALDIAFQCSPDHPYVKEHPSWFKWRPDGMIQFAENPPKRYEDILPFNFESDDWRNLWEELKSVFLFWIGKGVKIFRVDNPHTKPFPFWEWVIQEVKRKHPDVLFLAEAFTRPKVMYRLAKVGFTQSYTYFTWRNAKHELIDYVTELTKGTPSQYFRPNFWPNTPDILPEYLQYGGRPAFLIRFVLAATLSSSYGIYGPAYELCVNASLEGKEEYLNSEKYEIKCWDLNAPGNIRDFVKRINAIRQENQALHTTDNVEFYTTDNENIIFYERATEDESNIVLIAVNLDPFHTQSGWVGIPLERLGLSQRRPFFVHDLLSDERYLWEGERIYVELDPAVKPAHIFRLYRYARRENDFDYFM